MSNTKPNLNISTIDIPTPKLTEQPVVTTNNLPSIRGVPQHILNSLQNTPSLVNNDNKTPAPPITPISIQTSIPINIPNFNLNSIPVGNISNPTYHNNIPQFIPIVPINSSNNSYPINSHSAISSNNSHPIISNSTNSHPNFPINSPSILPIGTISSISSPPFIPPSISTIVPTIPKYTSPIDNTPIVLNGTLIDRSNVPPIVPIPGIPRRQLNNQVPQNNKPITTRIPANSVLLKDDKKKYESTIQNINGNIFSPQNIIGSNSPKFVVLDDPEDIKIPMIDLPKFEVKEGMNTPIISKNINIHPDNIISDLPLLIPIQTPIPPEDKRDNSKQEDKRDNSKQEDKKDNSKQEEKRDNLKQEEKKMPPKPIPVQKKQSSEPTNKPKVEPAKEVKSDIKNEDIDPDLIKKRVDRFKHVPDFDNMEYEDQIRARVTLEINFSKIAQRYPQFNIKIPDRSESLRSIHIRYMQYLRKTTIDSGVFQWRQYLILTWALMELICTKVLGIAASGFCMNQLMRMNIYDDLLEDLGEKYNGSITAGWSVEVKLLFYTSLHIVVFIVTNYICKYFGENAGNAVRNMIDNFSTGKVVYPTGDQNGNLRVPAGIPPSPEAGNVQSIPVPPVARIVSDLPIGNMNLLGNLFGGGNNNQNQNQNNNNNPNNNNINNNKPGKRRPKFTE